MTVKQMEVKLIDAVFAGLPFDASVVVARILAAGT
jgi:hypothetical protein